MFQTDILDIGLNIMFGLEEVIDIQTLEIDHFDKSRCESLGQSINSKASSLTDHLQLIINELDLTDLNVNILQIKRLSVFTERERTLDNGIQIQLGNDYWLVRELDIHLDSELG